MPETVELEAGHGMARRHLCAHCDTSFRRKEHLERHLQRHTGVKSFACDHCDKQFSRRDVFQRHLSVHATQTTGPSIVPSGRRNRACKGCAKHKKRCTGGVPCDQCLRRNTFCSYRHLTGDSSPDTRPLLGASVPTQSVHDLLPDRWSLDTSAASLDQSLEMGVAGPPENVSGVTTSNADLDHNDFGLLTGFTSLDERLWNDTDLAPLQMPYGLALAMPLDQPNASSAMMAGDDSVFSQNHEALRLFPLLSQVEEGIVAAETFGESPAITDAVVDQILQFYELHSSPTDRSRLTLVLQAFVELYFRFFAVDAPFVHSTSLSDHEKSWILVLAIAMTGSQYSKLPQINRFTQGLRYLLQKAIDLNFPASLQTEALIWAQIRLLYDVNLCFGGIGRLQSKQQFEKNTLVSLCRAVKVDMTSIQTGTFEQWMDTESRIRLLHHAYRFECLQFALLDSRPAMNLGDIIDVVPSDDKLWQCRDELAWRSYQSTTAVTRPRFLAVETGANSLDHFLASDLSKELQYLYLYVEERLTLELLRKQPLQRMMLTSLASTGSVETSDVVAGRPLNPNKACSSVSASMDAVLMAWKFSAYGEDGSLVSETQVETLRLGLQIIRAFPLRTLHALTGWQANDSQIAAAQATFRSWIQADSKLARMCFVHALIVFTSLRVKESFNPHEPLVLLVAAIFIWAFDTTAEPHFSGTPASGEATGTLRFDRHIHANKYVRWIESGGPVSIYLAGVGFLDGDNSPVRVFHELQRVLQSRKQWHILCKNLANNVQQFLNGQRPHHLD